MQAGADSAAEEAQDDAALLELPGGGAVRCSRSGRGEALFMYREIATQRCYLAPGGLDLRDGGVVIDAGANIGAHRDVTYALACRYQLCFRFRTP